MNHGHQQMPFLVPLTQSLLGHHGPPDHVPARVRAAAEYLHFAFAKQQPEVYMGEGVGNVETVAGQDLTTTEAAAQHAAADLLTAYFEGKYRETPAEKEGLSRGVRGVFLRCLGCGGNASLSQTCSMCKGCGDVVVFPATAVPDYLKGGTP